MSKELDMMSGLNSYEYGTRQYYSVVPAWDRVDPLCENCYNISPNAYCMGNPVNAIDPDGREPYFGLSKGNWGTEAKLLLCHPLAALQVGLPSIKNTISYRVSNFAINAYYNIKEDRGSKRGAFRHTLWMAAITSRWNSEFAERVAKSHEDACSSDLTRVDVRLDQRNFGKGEKELDKADTVVDMLNNQIGRRLVKIIHMRT